MMGAQYSAITAKVRAMYGRRLTREDFDRLAACRTLAEAASYLKTCPGWQTAVRDLPVQGLSRSRLEAALETHLMEEYVRLYRFAGLEDKRFLLFPLYKYELESILAALRRLLVSDALTAAPRPAPDFYLQRSRLDFTRLAAAASWRDIVEAGWDTIYRDLLSTAQVSPETGRPDYTAVSVALQGVYYAAMHRFVMKKYPGDMGKVFRSAVGSEIDLLNLAHVMRLKRYFPDSPQSLDQLLFPVHHKLRPEFFQRLMDAPDYDRAMELMGETVYGKFFREHDFPYIDQYYEERLTRFNRRQLVSGGPSPYIATAYLYMKDVEMRELFRVIEGIYYGRQEQVRLA